MYWERNDERLRAYSCLEGFGYGYAAGVFDDRVNETAGVEQQYWLRVRGALDSLVEEVEGE